MQLQFVESIQRGTALPEIAILSEMLVPVQSWHFDERVEPVG